MNYRIEDIITGIQTLTLRPGDVVALLCPNRLSEEARARLNAELRLVLPASVTAIVLEDGMTLARVTVDYDEQRVGGSQ